MEGGIVIASQGSVIARVYTSDAYLPLQGVPVVFMQALPGQQRKLLAIRMTDSSGLTAPLFLETPDLSSSLTPGATPKPYAVINIRAFAPGYNSITAEGIQIFPGIETIQGLQLRPVSPSEQDTLVTLPGNEQNL